MISIYGGVLSTIEKALQKLIKKYQSIGKSLQNLVEGQKRNIVQLERIGAAIEWRWSLKKGLKNNREKNKNEKNRDEKKKSENSPRKS